MAAHELARVLRESPAFRHRAPCARLQRRRPACGRERRHAGMALRRSGGADDRRRVSGHLSDQSLAGAAIHPAPLASQDRRVRRSGADRQGARCAAQQRRPARSDHRDLRRYERHAPLQAGRPDVLCRRDGARREQRGRIRRVGRRRTRRRQARRHSHHRLYVRHHRHAERSDAQPPQHDAHLGAGHLRPRAQRAELLGTLLSGALSCGGAELLDHHATSHRLPWSASRNRSTPS
jgi:hypothetical protein